MATPDVPARWIALAAEAIDGEEATATYGYEGASWRVDIDHAPDLAREALRPMLADLRRQVAERRHEDECSVPRGLARPDEVAQCNCLRGDVLDLLDTGGTDDSLHREVSRMAAGLVLFYDVNTKGDIRMVADRFAAEVISTVISTIHDDGAARLRLERDNAITERDAAHQEVAGLREQIAQAIEAHLPGKSEWTTRTLQAAARIARRAAQ